MKKIRSIAIHLPQFHPFKENDDWWGKGFTEWTNVTKAKPLFKGHYQPHLPSDLGFYDLRLEEARLAQIDLARKYGIYGFCYYHYWFNGKRLMNEPLDRMLANPKEDFPFMLCWANENWTRTWDGKDHEVLIKQEYSREDHIAHIKSLVPFFKDDRYIKVKGKPVFVIYKSDDIPFLEDTLLFWRETLKGEGIEIYFCRIERVNSTSGLESLKEFDAAIEFQPLSSHFKNFTELVNSKKTKNHFINMIKRKCAIILNKYIPLDIHDYNRYIEYDLSLPKKNYKLFPGVSPMWDNTSRKKEKALIFKNCSPDSYYNWLLNKILKFEPYTDDENFIFINAWNEWAEGNHLEPCQKFKSQYLEATKRALLNSRVIT